VDYPGLWKYLNTLAFESLMVGHDWELNGLGVQWARSLMAWNLHTKWVDSA
jgi:hypothetical protein